MVFLIQVFAPGQDSMIKTTSFSFSVPTPLGDLESLKNLLVMAFNFPKKQSTLFWDALEIIILFYLTKNDFVTFEALAYYVPFSKAQILFLMMIKLT